MENFCEDSNMSVIKDIWESIPTKQQPEKMTKYKKQATLAPVTIDTRNIDRLMAHGKDGDDMFASLLREIDNYGLSMTISPKDGTCIMSELSAPSSTCGEDSFSSEKSTCGEPFKIFEEEKEENSTMTTTTTSTTTTTNPSPPRPSLERNGDTSICTGSITSRADKCVGGGTSGESMVNNGGEEEDLSPTLRLRGLPYNAREEDVKEFFGYHARFLRADNPISLIPNRDGRPSGLAMACFVSQATARIAQRDLDRKMMGTRYIEVFGPLNHNTHRFMKNPGPMTEVMVLRELRALLRKKGSMLMSMLGVLLSDEGRQFLKSQGIGLKAFFQRVKDEFAIEGKEGEEKLFWLHPKNNPHTMSHGQMAPLGGHGQHHHAQHQHQHAQQHQYQHAHQRQHQHAQQQRQNGYHFSEQMNNHMNNDHGGLMETPAHPHNAAMGMGHQHQQQQQQQQQQHYNQSQLSSERPKVHGRSKSHQHPQQQQQNPATHGTHATRNNFYGHKNTNANGVSIGANSQNVNGHRGYGKNGGGAGGGGIKMTDMNKNNNNYKNKNIQHNHQKHQVQQYQQQQQQHSMSHVKKHMNYHGNNDNTPDKRFFVPDNSLHQSSNIINQQGGSLTTSSVDSFTPAVIPMVQGNSMGSYGHYDARAW